MNYAEIKSVDFNNGDGINVSLWVSGCPHKCEGCHNQELWNPELGEKFTIDTIAEILALMDKRWKPDLAILGGEPLADYNYEDIVHLCHLVKFTYPDRKIWLWTGYEPIELAVKDKLDILDYIDYIIVGRFDKGLKDNSLEYRGSSNQTVYKVKDGGLEFWR